MHSRTVERTRIAFRALLVAGLFLAASPSLPLLAATVTVTGTGDTIAVDGLVTLREAVASINAGANVNADVAAVGAYGTGDAIAFNIPGAGVRTIAPTSALNLTQPVLINGYTQPGASANTNGPTQGTNAVLLIQLDLTSANGGFNVAGGTSEIRGLVLNRSTSNAIALTSNNNVVAGNFIGTNPAGTAAGPGNAGDGVFVAGTGNRIGGTAPGDRNLISANGWGLRINNGSNLVQGNLIGTIAVGTFALGNVGQGIGATGASNVIGGGTPAERNIVAANGQHGILINGSNSLIAGNYVGTEVAGGSGLGNGQDGIVIAGPNNTVGGLAGFGNLVSGNGSHGINITNQSPGGATIIGNIVGATASATLPIGGQINGGLEIGPFSSGNTVSRNVFAFNLGPGVYVAGQGPTGGTGNRITENSIHGNGLLGIKLGTPANGTGTPNDPGDPDTGPNGLQNYPVVTSASIAAGTLTVGGTFNSLPNAQFTIEVFVNQFCDGNLFGEGQTFLGSFGVSTNGAGNASFGPLNFSGVPAGQAVVTMTATNDATGDTSEFSACFPVSAPLPTITINDVSQLEGNAGTTPFVFTVTISSTANATVNFATADGTASAGSDYAAASGTVTFTAGGPLTQTVTVLVNGDTLVEPNETFFVNLSGATGATIADAQGLGTILNDDTPPIPTITINDVSQVEGNAGTTPFVFTVSISASANATVNFATADGTASAGSDYAAASGTVTFTAGGALTQTVTVLVNGDTLVEPNETFFVNLSGASGATIADAQGVGTIVNDDALPTITINDVSQLEGNAGTTPFVFTVSISASANATVNFATADGTANAGSDYAAASGTVTFTAGGPLTQAVTVLVNGDTLVEPNETFFVNLSGASGATIADAQGVGTILNDDVLPTPVEPIPTLGEWQLIALMFLLAAAGALARRDRRRQG